MVLLQTVIPTDSIAVVPADAASFGQLIKEGNFQQLMDNMLTWGLDLLVNILIAAVLFVIGRFLIIKIDGFVGKVMRKSSWDVVLKGFLRSVIQTFLFVVLFMIIINAVGVKTVSIAAIIAAVGLAVGLAMKDNLANFAGGVMILLSKPFRGGDFIRAQNLEGTVESIGILHTVLRRRTTKPSTSPTGRYPREHHQQQQPRWDPPHGDRGQRGLRQRCRKVKELMLAIANEHSDILSTPSRLPE